MVGLGKSLALTAARVLLAGLFVYEATLLWKNGAEAGFRYVESGGLPAWSWWFSPVMTDVPVAWRLPGWSWWLALFLNGIGGIFVIVGLFTRLAAVGFMGFCLMTSVFFHNRLGIGTEAVHFGKDMGLAGGFLLLAIVGPGPFSVDAVFRGRP